MSLIEKPSAILQAAFDKLSDLESMWGDEIPWAEISQGFVLGTETVLMANKARGIFKPRQMTRGLMSIKTTEPRAGRERRYNDLEIGSEFYQYALQVGDVYGGGNRHLWEAKEDQSPFVYFHAVAPGIYKAIWPCYVLAIHLEKQQCDIIVGPRTSIDHGQTSAVIYALPSAPERAYAIRESRIRLFQATFRENVLLCYKKQCAISQLKVPQLLDAAHITPDSDEDSTTEVSNGIALSKLHHRAFDAHFIGISPDRLVEVGPKLRSQASSYFLDSFMKCHGSKIFVPSIKEAQADQDRLARRYEKFKRANNI
jgi:putative restriction endonuclease